MNEFQKKSRIFAPAKKNNGLSTPKMMPRLGHIIKYVKDTKIVASMFGVLNIFATLSLSLSLSHSSDKRDTSFLFIRGHPREDRLSIVTAMGSPIVFYPS